jgi:hypothetical protein
LKDSAGKVTHVRLLGSDRDIKWSQDAEALELDFGSIETGDHGYAVEVTLETAKTTTDRSERQAE